MSLSKLKIGVLAALVSVTSFGVAAKDRYYVATAQNNNNQLLIIKKPRLTRLFVIPNQLSDFERLQGLHNICKLSSVVLPPCDQGIIWSPSIFNKSKWFLQCGQIPCCF